MQKIELRIPEDRIGVLIGKEGEIKGIIEERTGCKLRVNSRTGLVRIEGEDAIGFLKARDVINAIAHGFNPEIALKLLDEFNVLDIIELTDYVPDNALQRVKGRVIGKEGKIRKNIEDLLGVNISVYGKTVAIIGDPEAVNAAREAILMIIEGAQHSTVQRFIERRRRDLKLRSYDWQELF